MFDVRCSVLGVEPELLAEVDAPMVEALRAIDATRFVLDGEIIIRSVNGLSFDALRGGRFRHGTTLLRWRPDKAPEQCTMDQLRPKSSRMLALLDG